MEQCELCNIKLSLNQKIVFENEHSLFLQLDDYQEKGVLLEGCGIIIPKRHRQTVFDLTREEWISMYELIGTIKNHIDQKHSPEGYNIGWNINETGGQNINHAHMHIIPRYSDENLAGQGIRSHLKSEKNYRNAETE